MTENWEYNPPTKASYGWVICCKCGASIPPLDSAWYNESLGRFMCNDCEEKMHE